MINLKVGPTLIYGVWKVAIGGEKLGHERGGSHLYIYVGQMLRWGPFLARSMLQTFCPYFFIIK